MTLGHTLEGIEFVLVSGCFYISLISEINLATYAGAK